MYTEIQRFGGLGQGYSSKQLTSATVKTEEHQSSVMADLCTIMTIYLHLGISPVRYTSCYSMFSAIQENRFWSMRNGFEMSLGEGTINCSSGTQEDASKLRRACAAAIGAGGSAGDIVLAIRVAKGRGILEKLGRMASPRVLVLTTKQLPKGEKTKAFLRVLKYSSGGVLEKLDNYGVRKDLANAF
ncbi:hypothetical protein ZIOFF_061893 [Zingiber officinale]|uniref:Uncharacterized protein n=1 Tax=Zingiber officinale TaxID=94328 RepID=A0A8J5K8U7_ZINOF|nr:hypothetical protein ZIOFF_061893 [Zingiber officinale]